MSDIIGINEAISPGSRIVVKILCTEVVPPPLIQQPYVVMMKPDEGPPICPTSQVQVEVETTQFDPLQHASTQFDPLKHKTIARENTKRVQKPRASEVLKEELDDLSHMDFNDDEPNIETKGGVGLGEDAPVNAETEARVGLGGEAPASNNEEEVDEVDSWNRWVGTSPDYLDAKEGYYLNYSSVDGDDGPTQADINRCDDEFRDLAKEWSTDGTIFSITVSRNLIQTCPGRSGQSNKNANAQWVAKEAEEIIRTVRTTRPASLKEQISRRRLKAKIWEEPGLVLVPRAQPTLIRRSNAMVNIRYSLFYMPVLVCCCLSITSQHIYRYSHSYTGLKCAEGTHSGLTSLKYAKGMGKGLTCLKCVEGMAKGLTCLKYAKGTQ
ncbi:hypothetical protein GIB67_043063 [Kingdonia uniflora]|uniref:Uncharacterized protein n=1 Tax=Kingdonia uniflora TaxID=39325 RepID=A0A7J7M9U0_9MAGN|nr:hypothetical protein GIB67_043063 [Kingdonia uniflora]